VNWKIPHEVQEFLRHTETLESDDAPIVAIRVTARQRDTTYNANIELPLKKAE